MLTAPVYSAKGRAGFPFPTDICPALPRLTLFQWGLTLATLSDGPLPMMRSIKEGQDIVRRHLAEVGRHIHISNDVIRRQRALIRKREREGHDTKLSQELLNTFLETHSLHLRDRDRLRVMLA